MYSFGSAHSVEGCKNDKIIHKINEVQPVTLGSTHNDDKKYKYSFSGSATFT
jgi:hypothetical protein